MAASEQRRSTTGPTLFPREYPRPTPPPASAALYHFLVTNTRAPLISALLFRFLTYPYVLRPAAEYFTKRWGSQRVAFGVMLSLTHCLSYISTWGLFQFVEHSGWFEKYRIGRTPGQVPTKEMEIIAFRETAQGWPGMIFLGQIFYYILHKLRGSPRLLDKMPGFFEIFKQMALGNFWSAVCFYYLHRVLHHKLFYEWIHKKHHEFVGVRTVAAQSLHPIEMVLQVPTNLISAVIHATHPLLFLHYLAWRVYTGMEGHSGFSFRGSFLHKLGLTYGDECLVHDMHHLESHKGNFGTFWMDWLHGTQDFWLKVGEEDGYLELCKKRELAALEREKLFQKQDEEVQLQKQHLLNNNNQ